MLHLIQPDGRDEGDLRQPEVLPQAAARYFGCGTPMENDANTGWFKGGQNIAKAQASCSRKSGYDGRPVVVLQATNIAYMNNAARSIAQWMQRGRLQRRRSPASDWGARGHAPRRARRRRTRAAGTSSSPRPRSTPSAIRSAFAGHAANGDKGWFGWPTDEKHEAAARQMGGRADARRAQGGRARDCRRTPGTSCRTSILGQWFQPARRCATSRACIGMPELIPFWNVEKTA